MCHGDRTREFRRTAEDEPIVEDDVVDESPTRKESTEEGVPVRALERVRALLSV